MPIKAVFQLLLILAPYMVLPIGIILGLIFWKVFMAEAQARAYKQDKRTHAACQEKEGKG